MSHKLMLSVVAIACCVFQSGCCSEQETVPLSDAMQSVGEGLSAMRNASGGKSGLVADDVAVTFNIASIKKTNAGVEIGVTAAAPASLKVPINAEGKATYELSNQLTSGTQITVHFKNVLYAAPGSLVYDRYIVPAKKTVTQNQKFDDKGKPVLDENGKPVYASVSTVYEAPVVNPDAPYIDDSGVSPALQNVGEKPKEAKKGLGVGTITPP